MVIVLSKKWLSEQMGELYFHGLPLNQYVENGAFLRLQNWLGMDLSFELAILAMVALSENWSSSLNHGVICDPDNGSKEEHAWVEYRKNFRWYVADFSRGYPGVYLKDDYFGKHGYGRNISPRWRIGYNEIWKFDLMEALWSSLHFEDYSYVMQTLNGFRPSEYSPHYAFEEWVISARRLIEDGRHLVPFAINKRNPRRPISTEIIQDFAKKRIRMQPKMKHLRKAMKEMKRHNNNC